MTRRCWLNILYTVCLWVCLSNGLLWAQTGMLVVNVQDAQEHPRFGAQVGVEGDGGSAVTDDHGKARIRLAAQNKRQGGGGEGFSDRAALEDGSVLAALTAKINKTNAP